MVRITKAIQLTPGRDDDLIAWFDTLPPGQGQEFIRDALRRGIQEQQSTATPIAQHVQESIPAFMLNEDTVREVLDYLIKGIGDKFVRAVQGLQVVGTGEAPIPAIKARDDLLDEIMGGLADWGASQ